jgi:hypothetical protein
MLREAFYRLIGNGRSLPPVPSLVYRLIGAGVTPST